MSNMLCPLRRMALMLMAYATHVSAITPLPPVATSSLNAAETDVQTRVRTLIAKTKTDLIYVKGGKFQMGDFGQVRSKEKLPYSGQAASLPLHAVELDGFSLGRYKVTYEDFDVFTDATGKDRVAQEGSTSEDLHRVPNVPVGVSWSQARAYCLWLGEQTGLRFDLPTEAQYEYAARNRGRFVLWPTDNGKFEEGKNIASYEQRESLMAGAQLPFNPQVYPIGRFAANPLGFYDMGANGWDWLLDWYAEDYYAHSPHKNPQGPADGAEKAQRGVDGGAAYTALTMYRHKHPPDGSLNVSNGFRCAVNSRFAVNH